MKYILCTTLLLVGCQSISDDIDSSLKIVNVAPSDLDLCTATYFPPEPARVIVSFHLGNSAEQWHVQMVNMPEPCLRAKVEAITFNSQRLIVVTSNTIRLKDIGRIGTHELGHVLNLQHINDATSVMFATAKTNTLTASDIEECIIVGSCSLDSICHPFNIKADLEPGNLREAFSHGADEWNGFTLQQFRIHLD